MSLSTILDYFDHDMQIFSESMCRLELYGQKFTHSFLESLRRKEKNLATSGPNSRYHLNAL